MKILLVDDEELIRDVIKEYCTNENYNVLEAENGLQAVDIVKNNPDIDMIILDIMMPKLDGFSALKEIKQERDIPVIILSARSEEYDKLIGFDIGIDDYVTKPFSPKELIARIKAIMKRNNDISTEEIITIEDLTINLKGHNVLLNNKELKLTPKEYELLCYFVANQGIALSREQLLNKIWGYDFFGDNRTVDTHIKMLRNNLGKYRDLIKTVRAVGYKFEIPKE